MALQESRAIWHGDAPTFPDILLSLGTGHNGEEIDGPVSEMELDTFTHRHFCAPLANFFIGDGHRYHQRWFWENFAFVRSLAILKHRSWSVLDAEQQWTQFQTTHVKASERDSGRYCRMNPRLDKKLPDLDDFCQITDLEASVSQVLEDDPTYKEQIARISHRLISSCFYFTVSKMVPGTHGWVNCHGRYSPRISIG